MITSGITFREATERVMMAKLSRWNSDTTAPSGREQYHLQFMLQTVSLEAFGYTLVQHCNWWSHF